MVKLHRYIPHLRWKQNERIALRHLSPQGREEVAPLVTLTADQFKGGKPSKSAKHKKVPLSAAEAFGKQVSDSWGNEPFFLDASDLSIGTTSGHHLDGIAAVASAAGMRLIPATKVTAPPDYLQAIARAHKAYKNGAALRIGLSEMTFVTSWLGSWKIPPQETDLIVDLRSSVANVAALGTPAAQSFASLHLAKQWRTVTMAGGCVPPTLTGYKLGATPLTRDELNFWRTLFAFGLPYRLDFGDYCSQIGRAHV